MPKRSDAQHAQISGLAAVGEAKCTGFYGHTSITTSCFCTKTASQNTTASSRSTEQLRKAAVYFSQPPH